MQKYFHNSQDMSGNALVGSVITVTDSLGATATIYSDSGGTVLLGSGTFSMEATVNMGNSNAKIL